MMVLPLLLLIPLVAALALVFLRGDKAVRYVALAASLIEIAVAAPLLGFDTQLAYEFPDSIYQAFLPFFPFQYEFIIPWVPQWGINFHLAVDGISIILVALSLFTLPFCILCSWTSITERVKEFHICLLLMTTACVGVFTAMDLVLFYVFWEAMLIPMFLLIAIWGGAERRYASVKFFLYTLAGSVFLLAAFAALRYYGGSFSIPVLMGTLLKDQTQIWVFLALALAFAVKIPMFPLHTWLPAAHVQAPVAGSVMLAAVLLKMGGYGFIRFCLAITPYAAETFAPLMIVLSVCGIIYGGLLALGQTDIKKLVAYSSVAHMGFVTMGIFMLDKIGVQGAIMQMLNHGIVTGALFMLIGVLYERSHSREIGDNLGIGRYMPLFIGLWILFSLASFGFPGTNGFAGELMVFISAFNHNLAAGAGLVVGALLSAAYMLRVTIKLAWGRPVADNTNGRWKKLNAREKVYCAIPAVLVVVIGLSPMPVVAVSSKAVDALDVAVMFKPSFKEKMERELHPENFKGIPERKRQELMKFEPPLRRPPDHKPFYPSGAGDISGRKPEQDQNRTLSGQRGPEPVSQEAGGIRP